MHNEHKRKSSLPWFCWRGSSSPGLIWSGVPAAGISPQWFAAPPPPGPLPCRQNPGRSMSWFADREHTERLSWHHSTRHCEAATLSNSYSHHHALNRSYSKAFFWENVHHTKPHSLISRINETLQTNLKIPTNNLHDQILLWGTTTDNKKENEAQTKPKNKHLHNNIISNPNLLSERT